MENMVEFGVPPEIVAFVIPTGYSFNLDGSTLYLSLAAIFCAQVAGVQKSVGEQILILITLMLTSKGVAAVPRASFLWEGEFRNDAWVARQNGEEPETMAMDEVEGDYYGHSSGHNHGLTLPTSMQDAQREKRKSGEDMV
ncbi:hypothetical protein BGW42_004705 [Actinomortierella wolfii]|nr:hypothetical protein BGW42_004705 [Actinomortierella wolfii]